MTERSDTPELTNIRAERVAAVRALSGRSARSRAGAFLVEGPQGVREAVRFAAERVRELFVTLAAADRYSDVVDEARTNGVRVRTATPEVVATMSGDAQGILAVVRSAVVALDDVLASSPRLVAVCVNVRDPGNAGTVIRAADAAGADAVVLAGNSVDLTNPKTVRSTAGSLFHLPVVVDEDTARVVRQLQRAHLLVLAADGSGSHDLDDLLDDAGQGQALDLARSTAWMFGNEAWGLTPDDAALADAVVRVPLRGKAESLNLAAAATVCLYASSRAHRV